MRQQKRKAKQGIAGWGYPVRTEKHSEYVVVHLVNPLRAASSNSRG